MASSFNHTLNTTVMANPPSHTVTIADADLQTLVNYLVSKYTPRGPASVAGPSPQPVVGGPSTGVSPPPQTPAVAPTPQQAISLWLQEAYARVIAEVQNSQASAQQPVTPINVTIT